MRQTKIVRLAAIIASLHFALAIAQPFLGGMLLGGSDIDALSVHSWNGRVLFVGCAATSLALGLAWRNGALPSSLPLISLALLAAEGWQIHLGFVDELLWHIPLGSVIVAGAAILAYAIILQALRPGENIS